MTDTQVIRPAAFEQVELLLDVGQVPHPHKYANKWVITLQIAPLENLEHAKVLERTIREMLQTRFGIKFQAQSQ
jgi:hypothetical protein